MPTTQKIKKSPGLKLAEKFTKKIEEFNKIQMSVMDLEKKKELSKEDNKLLKSLKNKLKRKQPEIKAISKELKQTAAVLLIEKENSLKQIFTNKEIDLKSEYEKKYQTQIEKLENDFQIKRVELISALDEKRIKIFNFLNDFNDKVSLTHLEITPVDSVKKIKTLFDIIQDKKIKEHEINDKIKFTLTGIVTQLSLLKEINKLQLHLNKDINFNYYKGKTNSL